MKGFASKTGKKQNCENRVKFMWYITEKTQESKQGRVFHPALKVNCEYIFF